MRLTVPIVIPGAGAGDMLKANNLGDVLSPATARNNLRVLERDDAWAAAISRVPRSGIWFDGNVSYRLGGYTNASGIPLGLNDFSITLTVTLQKYTGTGLVFWISHQSGNNRCSLQLTSSGVFRLSFVDGAGSTQLYDMAPDVALVDGETYFIAVTVDRDGVATLSVNAESDRDFSGAGVTVSVAAAASIDIGSGNTATWGAAQTFNGVLSSLRVFNRLLSSGDVKKLLKGGVVDYADQYANLTAPVYTSNFSAGVDGWTGTLGTAAGNIDSIGGQDDVLRFTVDGSTGAHFIGRSNSVNAFKNVRVRAKVYIPSTNAVVKRVTVEGTSSSVTFATVTTTDAWVEVDAIAAASHSTPTLYFMARTNAGSSNVAGNTTDVFYVKDVIVSPAGCGQDLECGVGAGTHVPDRTTNFPGRLQSTSGTAHTYPRTNNDIIVRRALTHSEISHVAAATNLLDLPPNAGILDQQIEVTEAFDAATTLDIGVAGTQGKYAAGIDLATTGLKFADSLSKGNESSSLFTTVYAKKNQPTTQGKLVVRTRYALRGL
ncbi:MAG TPA: LamG-like jellyroll fold domain-containing protein [Methylomirabilota bacterium]|nr:LamG-like jellyroll fold domain-containing protein [Methylomirabilota bacterium]